MLIDKKKNESDLDEEFKSSYSEDKESLVFYKFFD